MFQNIILVGTGGFLGSVFRYWLSVIMKKYIENPFPFATFVVNITGSFAIGILFALLVNKSLSDTYRLFLMVGICGGFTTFSSFSLENLQLFINGQVLTAIFYIVASVVLGLAATYLGYILIRN